MKTIISLAALAIFAIPTLQAEEAPKPAESKATQDAVKPYKPDVCMVSDEKLGEMGKPVVFVYQGQEIKLCCKSCRKKFDKDPAKYLKKLAEASK